ncbi:MAG: hypothetical protein CMC40_02655 [Flavobacteriaceae bacterium]|nr:hypothetical protein [Flavobacteriaceae bacterium]|tara:strand:- start:4 stop:609 length:606 start_codon:yes stop_codon:yes gene_type:complete
MQNYNSDPKPGRLILPLVLIGMIATTYTFINRVATNNDIELVLSDTTTTSTAQEVIDSTTSTTTTTIPEGIVNYLEEITGEKIQAIELGKKVLETNQRWDDKVTTYQEAQVEFEEFIEDFASFVIIFTNPGPPSTNSSLVSSHEELTILVNLIADDTVELLEGLTAPDTGERRAAALESFNSNLDLFVERIEQLVASATSS